MENKSRAREEAGYIPKVEPGTAYLKFFDKKMEQWSKEKGRVLTAKEGFEKLCEEHPDWCK